MKPDLVLGRTFAVLVGSILVSVLARNFFKSNKRSTRRKAGDTVASGSSAASVGSENYDVFLSFSGRDTRKTLADHLYNGLVDAGIRVFKDDIDLPEGENFGINLLQAIKNSEISIPILSLNYPSSKWCLQELVEMTECMKSDRHVVLPIFYRVDPADVRYQKGSFGETFSHLSKKYVEEDVARWKQALQEVASLNGWVSEITADGREGELVKMVVRKVWRKLNKAFQLVVSKQLVGIDNAVQDILRLLGDKSDAAQIVGIYGIGGIGKTTLAKVVYNKLLHQFSDHSFIEDIRESSKRRGILCLQNQFISDILGKSKQASNTDEGIRTMESRFKNKKVLILLDDVDHISQINALAGKHDWFGMGSKIIITTRIRFVLDGARVNCQYELKEIAKDEALILFSRHAFLKDSPPCEFESLSCAVVSTTGGLPLALEVIGSFLYGQKQEFWQDALKKLRSIPHEEVQTKLKITYDTLNHEEQQIFLDIACFFIGDDLRMASYMWDACNFFPNIGIERLSSMSLIKIEDDGKVKMHDQLRDLGREIVRREDYNVPMNRSRLWVRKEALEVLKGNKGIRKDRVLALRLYKTKFPNFDYRHFADFDDFDDFDDLDDFDDRKFPDSDDDEASDSDDGERLTAEKFETLSSLRLLVVHNAELIGDSQGLLPELRWLAWTGNPAFVANSFDLRKLVVLDLSDSDVSELWEGWSHLKVAKELKVLNLSYCRNLKITPNLSAFRNLEMLILKKCRRLEQIHPSIGGAKGLTFLNLSECEELQELPQEIGKLEELERLDISKSGIREIPPCIGSLKKLEVLDAGSCHFRVVRPYPISDMEVMPGRHSDSSRLCSLPKSIGSLMKLQCLLLGGTFIVDIPDSIGKLEWLTELDLGYSDIYELPESIGDMKNLKFLHLAYCEKLRSLPSTISKLGNLEELDASGCRSLEGEIHINGLSSLKILKLSRTCISSFTDAFDKLSHLEKLELYDCPKLQSLPQSIGLLPSLHHLNLKYCWSLQSLPEHPVCLTNLCITYQRCTLPQLSHLSQLEVLSVDNCKLLESMPELPLGLSELRVHYCYKLKELSLMGLECLSMLDLDSCTELTEIKGLGALKSLTCLNAIQCKKLSNLDGHELLLKNLEFLDISRCTSIETLPDLLL